MFFVFFFQAEDGIRDLVRSRGLGDVYKRQSSLPVALNGSSNPLCILCFTFPVNTGHTSLALSHLSLIHI